jgi:hypothetical protein
VVPGMLSELPMTFPRTAGQYYLPNFARAGFVDSLPTGAATDGDLMPARDLVRAMAHCEVPPGEMRGRSGWAI